MFVLTHTVTRCSLQNCSSQWKNKPNFQKKFSVKICDIYWRIFISIEIRPMGTHHKIDQPSPAQPMVFFQKKSAHGLGWAKTSPLRPLVAMKYSFEFFIYTPLKFNSRLKWSSIEKKNFFQLVTNKSGLFFFEWLFFKIRKRKKNPTTWRLKRETFFFFNIYFKKK